MSTTPKPKNGPEPPPNEPSNQQAQTREEKDFLADLVLMHEGNPKRVEDVVLSSRPAPEGYDPTKDYPPGSEWVPHASEGDGVQEHKYDSNPNDTEFYVAGIHADGDLLFRERSTGYPFVDGEKIEHYDDQNLTDEERINLIKTIEAHAADAKFNVAKTLFLLKKGLHDTDPMANLPVGTGKKIRFIDIDYDTDGEKVDLPKTLESVFEEDFDPEMDGADYISDETGWCVFGFRWEEIKEEPNDEPKVSEVGAKDVFGEPTNLPAFKSKNGPIHKANQQAGEVFTDIETPSQRYTFQAEASADITRLLRSVLPADSEFLLLRVSPMSLGGFEVECESSLSRDEMARLIGQVVDGHTMGRTLRSQTLPERPQPMGHPGSAPGRSPYPIEDLPGSPH
jgi:hypothetical protein